MPVFERFGWGGIRWWSLVLFLMIVTAPAGWAQSLEAGADEPLYTSYAAAPERTTLALDVTHTLNLHGGPAGLTVGTDADGLLGVVFRLAGEVRYRVDRFAEAPVVTASFGDVVRYRFEPFAGIEVVATTYVYSSAAVLHEVAVRNRRSDSVTLDLFPFYERTGSIRDVRADSGRASMAWRYDVPPDAWTRRHDQPYAAERTNLLVLDAAPDAFGVYPTRGTLEEEPWADIARAAALAGFIQEGTLHASDGTPCAAAPPQARLTLLRPGHPGELLTEELPATARGANLEGDGTQRLALDPLSQPPIARGDTFTVVAECAGEFGRTTAVVTAEGAVTAVDVQLADTPAVGVPAGVNLAMAQDGTGAIIRWDDVPDATYRLYRTAAADSGHYRLVADSLNFAVHYDFGLDPSMGYGYTVVAVDSVGRVSGHSAPVTKPEPPPPPEPAIPFLADVETGSLSGSVYPLGKEVAAFQKEVVLPAGASHTLRLARVAAPTGVDVDSLMDATDEVLELDVEVVLARREAAYRGVVPAGLSGDQRLLYLSAINLLRQHHMPAEGEAASPYLIYGRGRSEGWARAGQSLSEGLAALAYAELDPEAAQAMHGLYAERQEADGYVPHSVGPYVDVRLARDGERTSAAPWLSWIAWQLYEAAPDDVFLTEAYAAGTAFYDFWREQRDPDDDGLSSWGGDRAAESTRNGDSVVWQYLDDGEEIEALDLNLMLVQEARALARMAETLGDDAAQARWGQEAEARAALVRATFWDDETQFFYHVDAADHDFGVRADGDLKRREIIGFLALWAGAASEEQAAALVDALRDPGAFGRRYGVPSLAADDPSYHSAGRWDGPVWAPWQVLVVEGLRRYGYDEEARRLAERVVEGVQEQLCLTHQFWELYSPDHAWGGHRAPYVGSGVVIRLLNERVSDERLAAEPQAGPYLAVDAYPNPFADRLTLAYTLPQRGPARVAVYDVLGREVAVLADGHIAEGAHLQRWQVPDHLAGGVYVVVIEAGDRTERRTLVHVR